MSLRALLPACVAACTASADIPPEAPPAALTAAAPAVTPLVPAPSSKVLIEDERNTIDVFRAASPATVFVTQSQVVVDYFNRRTVEVPAGAGTGFFWDSQGHVVTNFHVVAGGRSFTVTLQDGTALEATVVGGDPRKDIAVLAVKAPPEKVVPVRLPPEGYVLEVGQKLVAIGNPYGLDHTLTTGVVSALDREIPGYGNVTIRGMIQTDASINPGNSGGPLLDSQGQLIGMNTMIYSKTGSSAGIGFAVPVATVRRVVDQLLTKGRVEQVGIGVRRLDETTARRLGLAGVVITEVLPGLPAEAAGLRGTVRTEKGIRLGDVIVKVDTEEIRSYDDLYNALDTRKAGEQVTVLVRRDGKELAVPVTLVVVNDGG